jgi:large repetitive protein
MKALSRAALVGTLATALVGLGLPLASLTALAGSAAPVFTRPLELTANPSDEGQDVVLHGEFSDADGDEEHYVVVSWGAPQSAIKQQSIPAGTYSFDISTKYPDDRPLISGEVTPFDTYDVIVTLFDGSGPDMSMPHTSQTFKHTVNDVAPDVHLDLSLTTIMQGDSVSATLWFTDPGHPGLSTPNPCPASRTPDCFTEKLDWGDSSADAIWEQTTLSQVMSFAIPAHRFDVAGTYQVSAAVTDDDGKTGSAKVTVVVGSKNTPPSDLRVRADVVSEGKMTTLTGSFSDPDTTDTHSVSIKWGDGTETALGLLAGDLDFSGQHEFAIHDSYTATITVKDAALAAASGTWTVLVRNTAPADLAMSPVTVTEGDTMTLSGTFSDSDKLDTHSVRIVWNDSSPDTTVPLGAGTHGFSATHVYTTHGGYKPTVTVTDLPANDSVTGSADVTVLVRNTAPADFKLSADQVVEGNATTLTGSFTDPDAGDTHDVSVNWGDSSTEPVHVDPGVLGFSVKHTYAADGSYHVTATIADPAKASADGWTDVTVLVHATTAGELLRDLATLVHSWDIDPMSAKVDAARDQLEVSTDGTCGNLKTLSNMVSAQTGKKISMDQVARFWSLVTSVDAAVPCTQTKAAPGYYSRHF